MSLVIDLIGQWIIMVVTEKAAFKRRAVPVSNSFETIGNYLRAEA